MGKNKMTKEEKKLLRKAKIKEDKKKGKGLVSEFVDFLKKGNALALAIGVIIGAAFTGIVNSLNKDILMPIIGALIGDVDFKGIRTPLWNAKVVVDANGTAVVDAYGQEVYSSAIYWGNFIQAIFDFLIIALVLFIIMKVVAVVMNNLEKAKTKLHDKYGEKEEEVVQEEVVVIPEDVKLLTEIRDLLKENKDR